MSTLEAEDNSNCQNNDSNNLFPIAAESLRFPLDSSMRIVFTGYYNGFSVEVRSVDEIALLYHMGCFGKGSSSRSKPKMSKDSSPVVMRRRQFQKRNYWYRKFGFSNVVEPDSFLKDIDELASKIVNDNEAHSNKDVIDLVSSDEDNMDTSDDCNPNQGDSFLCHEKQDIVVIVPNSDSEEDNYFANLKPKCCVNKIKIQEKLMLTLQEAFFLLYGLGCLQIIDLNNMSLSSKQCWQLFTKTDKIFLQKYVVYHYFRSKGYIVKPGIKFGGDYLLYKEGPGITHADFIVVIKNGQDPQDWIKTLGHVRMATTTVKEILLAEVIKPRKDIKLPEGLSSYSVREILLTRKFPMAINYDAD